MGAGFVFGTIEGMDSGALQIRLDDEETFKACDSRSIVCYESSTAAGADAGPQQRKRGSTP